MKPISLEPGQLVQICTTTDYHWFRKGELVAFVKYEEYPTGTIFYQFKTSRGFKQELYACDFKPYPM